jgi:hypothetical protein
MNRRSGRTSFENDDYSRFSGPDFQQDYHEVSKRLYDQQNFTGKGPRGYLRQDNHILEDVCEALTREPYVDASDIEVDVTAGIVTLKGSVSDRPSKRRAELCVEGITGVHDVNNELRVTSNNQAGTLGMIKNQSRLPS